MNSGPVLAFPEELMPRVQQRIKKKITVTEEGCHKWTGFTNTEGYGMMGITLAGKVRNVSAHRASWMAHKGPIPAEYVIDHLCRVRNCVNPDHLEPITANDNTFRGIRSRQGVQAPARPHWVDVPLWRAAMDKADTQNTKLSELIRGWLHDYVHEGEK